ncbi:MAG: DNA replication/repair protein RecF [Rhodospirillaceae bacterium]|nr:DNA replication/repair protein RecF [Rhodospirillaceae bacterium]
MAISTTERRRFAVRRLTLNNFRNYADLRIEPTSDMLVFTGANGAGKTNLLEAVSLLVPGRGLRQQRLTDLARQGQAGGGWAVAARVETPHGPCDVGTSLDPNEDDSGPADDPIDGTTKGPNKGPGRRNIRIDGETARNQSALAAVMSAHWLTPQMDRLFQEGSSARRRFLDRMVYGWDPAHAGRVAAYEQAMRQRMKLLRGDRAPDTTWVAALEETMASKGIAVTAARLDVVGRLATAAAEGWGPFPGAEIALSGDLENSLLGGPALAAEDRFRNALARSRADDARTGRTSEGPQRSDLLVRHRPKNQDAELCSTGEQKALLIGLVLANARTRATEEGGVPVLLLDEVAAHLDEARREALFEALQGLGGQVWLTGTDAELFQPLSGRAEFFIVADNGAERIR